MTATDAVILELQDIAEELGYERPEHVLCVRYESKTVMHYSAPQPTPDCTVDCWTSFCEFEYETDKVTLVFKLECKTSEGTKTVEYVSDPSPNWPSIGTKEGRDTYACCKPLFYLEAWDVNEVGVHLGDRDLYLHLSEPDFLDQYRAFLTEPGPTS